MRKEIDLKDPQLGSKLLEDPKGDFPLDVWETYCSKPFAHLGLYPLRVLSWRIDPKSEALDPQQAVDDALTCAISTLCLLKSNQPAEAMEHAKQTVKVLARAESSVQPKRGAPASMRPIAVRAWIIRKFNRASEVRWWKLANLLFLEKGKCCPRCGLPRHNSKSACVKALIGAVGKLESAMKDDRIPL